MNANLIGSGRTTRMLQEAITLASQGRAVYVIGKDEAHAAALASVCGEEARTLGIKFESLASVGEINWPRLRVYGSHPNCVFLFDHFALEYEFRTVLEMLHRYDSPSTDTDSPPAATVKIDQEDHEQILQDPRATTYELRSIIGELQAESTRLLSDCLVAILELARLANQKQSEVETLARENASLKSCKAGTAPLPPEATASVVDLLFKPEPDPRPDTVNSQSDTIHELCERIAALTRAVDTDYEQLYREEAAKVVELTNRLNMAYQGSELQTQDRLAAAQDDNARLREALEESNALNINWVSVAEADMLEHLSEYKAVIKMGTEALALHTDDSALNGMLKDEREKVAKYFDSLTYPIAPTQAAAAIRSMT